MPAPQYTTPLTYDAKLTYEAKTMKYKLLIMLMNSAGAVQPTIATDFNNALACGAAKKQIVEAIALTAGSFGTQVTARLNSDRSDDASPAAPKFAVLVASCSPLGADYALGNGNGDEPIRRKRR